VRRTPEPLVVVPARRVIRGSSPELHRRTEPRRRVVRRRRRFLGNRAALDRFAIPRAAHRF
jgi:hypothetical protein